MKLFKTRDGYEIWIHTGGKHADYGDGFCLYVADNVADLKSHVIRELLETALAVGDLVAQDAIEVK